MKNKLTIEKHLHELGEVNDNIKALESVYEIQKNKMEKYLISILSTFPTYSAHDANHSKSILTAIEGILGEEYIEKLSGIDSFLILMTAYMHDLGMIYTEEELRTLWRSDEFKHFLNDEEHSEEVQRAINLVNKKDLSLFEDSIWQLEVRRSVAVIMMEYFRPTHASRINSVTDVKGNSIAELLRLDEAFLPIRIINIVYKISKTHAMSFEDMLDCLVQEDSFAGEFFHPRMIAILLRMGDLCDLDNNRFNKVSISVFGSLGEENLAHYFKHRSIETLHISRQSINIVANVVKKDIYQECRDYWFKDEKDHNGTVGRKVQLIYQNTIREHIRWKNWMQQEITNMKLNVSRLFPEEWNFVVPEITYDIKLNSVPTVTSDQNLKFDFSQDRAFRLIENISIYRSQKFIFIREIIQNAIDASKIQLWRDIRGKYSVNDRLSPFFLEREASGLFEKYKISLRVHYDDEKKIASFSFEDRGIGISKKELKSNILTTGKSWKNRKEYAEELFEMPEWLRPTGAFGIGMHTIFAVTDQFTINTKSDREEYGNKIYLYSGKKGGHVFCERGEKETRGTIIEFEIPFSESDYQKLLENRGGHNYLKEVDDEFESAIFDIVTQYCKTPLFSIEVNGIPVVNGLVEATCFSDLSSDNRRCLSSDDFDSKRFEYAFQYDYEGVAVWDRKKNLAYSIEIEQGLNPYVKEPEINDLSFKGMKLDDSISIGDYPTPLNVVYLDIEGGESGEFIDAGRSTISDEKKRELQADIVDVLQFALKLYINLGKLVSQDEEVLRYKKKLGDLTKNYFSGTCKVRNLWKKVIEIRGEFFYADFNTAFGNYDRLNFESRVVSYIVYLALIDYMITYLVRDVVSSEILIQFEEKVLPAVDDMLWHFKSENRKTKIHFFDYYMKSQVEQLLNHIMVTWAFIFILTTPLAQKKNISKDDMEKVELTFYDKCKSFMPFVCSWGRTKNAYLKAVDVIGTYRYEDVDHGYASEEICDTLLRSLTSISFDEWNYRGGYIQNDYLSLNHSMPYLVACMYIPGSDDHKLLELWKPLILETVYGNLKLDGYNTVCDILGGTRVELLFDKSQHDSVFELLLPLQNNYSIIGARKLATGNLVTYETNNDSLAPDYDERMLRFLQSITLNCLLEFEHTHVALNYFEGCSRYSDISILQYNSSIYEYNILDGMLHKKWIIPMWDTVENVSFFLTNYDMSSLDEMVDQIAAMPVFDRTIRYIQRWKKKEGIDIEISVITNAYKDFLIDMLGAFYPDMPRG